MTVAIVFPRDTCAELRSAIMLAVGSPSNRVYGDTTDTYLYPDTDHNEIHFKISQHISNVIRKQKGHEFFLKMHGYFNQHIRILSENEYNNLYFGKAA